MCEIEQLKLRFHKCMTDKISVFIEWKGKNLGLCNECWNKLCDDKRDIEWGDSPRPIFNDILNRRAKEEASATLTEYAPHKKGSGKYKAIQQKEDEEITVEDEVAEAEGKALMEEDEERESQEEVSKS